MVASVLGEERTIAFIELVGLNKSKLDQQDIDAVATLDLAPGYADKGDINDFFFAKECSLGWSWGVLG